MRLGMSGPRSSVRSPGLFLGPGKPPCTVMALSWVTVKASSRAQARRQSVARTGFRHRIAGPWRSIPLWRTRSSFKLTANDSTANMIECAASGTPYFRPGCTSLTDQTQGSPMASSPCDFSPISHFECDSTTKHTPGVTGCFLVEVHRAQRVSSIPVRRLRDLKVACNRRLLHWVRADSVDHLHRAGSPPE
jgi:hypothetical protein